MTYRAFVIDMDGVLWHGDTPLPGLEAFFETLRELNLPFVLATNNATKVAPDYTAKLARFGVEVAPEHILTSSEATAHYLRRRHPTLQEVYVVGEGGLLEAVRAQGFRVVTPEDVRGGDSAPVVVAGLVRGALSYELLAMGAHLVRQGAELVATNADASYPSEFGELPGAGALLSVITTSTGAEATVIGKPGPAMFEEALERLGTRPQETAMVGDRLETDIAGGRAAGLGTVLLLSGVSRREDIGGVEPDHVFDDIRALSAALRRG